jgi:serine/threonine protein kinase
MYVVCEYCNGGSLKEYLNKKGQLSEYEGLKLFKVNKMS